MPPTPEDIKFSSHTGDDAFLIHAGHRSAIRHPPGPLSQSSTVSQNAAPGTFPDPLLSPIALSTDMTPFGGSSYDDKENYWYQIPRARGKPHSTIEIAKNILNTLREAKLTPLEFLTCLFDDSVDEFATFRDAFYKEHHLHRLSDLLNVFWKSDKGSRYMKDWMRPRAVDLICDTIHTEMDCAKSHLQMLMMDITPEFISTWDINGLMEPISADTS
jgi:hypothetical protein